MNTARPMWVALALLTACDGDQSLGLDDLAPAEAWEASEAVPAQMRRLTRNQLARSLADLFGPELVVPSIAEPDVVQEGLVAIGSSHVTYSPRGVESFETAALRVAEQVVSVPALRQRLGSCEDVACAPTLLADVGRRVWRRPLTSEEEARLVGVLETASGALGGFEVGLQYALGAMLQSPHFLYRVEVGETRDGARHFTNHELASRLSFLLWNTTPDDTLLDAADAGELTTDEGLFAQAARMLDDARAREGVRAYFTDHLRLDELDHLEKDPTLFEHFSPELGPDAREETLRLLEYVALDAELDYRDVATTPLTFLNPRLATLYGLPAPSESWSLVELSPSAQRAGLLGHASFLAGNAHAVSSSATLRGLAVRTRLLCQEIPAPPVDVDTSIPEPSGTAPTLRDRVAEHLENPSCAGCHNLMDPIGLGLENYDGLGRFRPVDNGVRIDTSGQLDGRPFADPIALGGVLRGHGAFAPCLARTMARYATGQHETEAVEPWIDTLAERFAVHGYRVRPLILELVMSPLFRRPGPDAEDAP